MLYKGMVDKNMKVDLMQKVVAAPAQRELQKKDEPLAVHRLPSRPAPQLRPFVASVLLVVNRMPTLTLRSATRLLEIMQNFLIMPLSRLSVRAVVSALVSFAALALAHPSAAQGNAVAPTAGSAVVPKTIALVAAVGDQFQYVRQKEGVGSRLEPFIRRAVTAPDQLLNRMVLRGLDRAAAAQYPDAERIMMALQPDSPELKVLPQDREAHTMGRVMEMLKAYPDRERWDQIMVVTPKWLMSERQGMGSKLSGIGMYVQPLGSGRDIMDETGLDEEVRDVGKDKRPRAKRFVAPFFYMQITVLDAKTLRVIRSEDRYDYRKMINSDSAALDVEASFTTEKLGAEIERFVETAARRLVNDKDGSIDIGPVKTLPVPDRQ